MCSLDIMFQRRPQDELLGKPEGVSHDDVPGVVYAATADADIWDRRLGHMNPRSMELLRRKEGNGVAYTGTVSDCDICALSKSRHQAHPKKSTRTTVRPMQLIYTDLMGPFTPPAKGGYRYVSKFTDDYARMKEVYLLRNKSEAAESLHQYNMTVAVPLGLRIEIVRCDKGGEYIGKEFKTLCVNAGINVEYTVTNTQQQNEVFERDGQTLAQITRCLMKDGNFPPSLWGELIFTAAILVQQVTSPSPGRSHAVLQDAQRGGRLLGTASHRSQSIRPPRDLYEEAGRTGVRRKAVRIQSRQQGLQDLQPSQGHGHGKPQRDLFGDAGIQPTPGRHVRSLPLRGRRPPTHVSTGRTFNGGGLPSTDKTSA